MTRRLSASTTIPLSLEVRMRRPTACLIAITACGKEKCAQARESWSSRSQESGSVGSPKGSFGITTPLRVAPGASKPSQKLFKAKRLRCSSFRKIIAQAFDGYSPFLTHQAQSCGFDLRIRQVKAFFHLFSICEEREH